MKHSENVVRATEVIGVTVKNPANEELGKIVDIILDKRTGKCNYAVLSFSSFFGFNNKLFAVPWEPLHYEVEKAGFVLNVTQDQLKEAPGFDKNNWPDFTEPSWGENIKAFYNKISEAV